MTVDLALLAEAGRVVGTGHLVEMLDLATEAKGAGLRPLLAVPDEAAAGLLARADVPVKRMSDLKPDTLAALGAWLADGGAQLAVTNCRAVTEEQVLALADAGLSVICIDESDGRPLNRCTAVINPSPVSSRHGYSSAIPGFAVYEGLDYLALASPAYAHWHSSQRRFAGRIQSVVVSMGGVDRTGATLRVAQALARWASDAERHLVVGAACSLEDDLERLLADSPGRWRIHHNLRCLADLFGAADVGVSAGGNTLAELACVGTPAVVLYEDEHEAARGRAFEAEGFGWCLGAGTAFGADAFRGALDRLQDPAARQAQGEAGKRLVDGRGTSRICQIIAEHVSVDSSVTP